MPDLLVVFATRFGACERIAAKVVSAAAAAGLDAHLHNLERPLLDLPDAARVIVVGAVYSNQHHDAVQAFLRAHRDALAARRCGLISVSLAAALTSEEGEQMTIDYVDELSRLTGFRPKDVLTVAGAVDDGRYDPATAALLNVAVWRRSLPAGDHVLTDVPALDRSLKRWFSR